MYFIKIVHFISFNFPFSVALDCRLLSPASEIKQKDFQEPVTCRVHQSDTMANTDMDRSAGVSLFRTKNSLFLLFYFGSSNRNYLTICIQPRRERNHGTQAEQQTPKDILSGVKWTIDAGE